MKRLEKQRVEEERERSIHRKKRCWTGMERIQSVEVLFSEMHPL